MPLVDNISTLPLTQAEKNCFNQNLDVNNKDEAELATMLVTLNSVRQLIQNGQANFAQEMKYNMNLGRVRGALVQQVGFNPANYQDPELTHLFNIVHHIAPQNPVPMQHHVAHFEDEGYSET